MMGSWWFVAACCLVQACVAYDWRNYEGYKLISVVPKSWSEVEYLAELQHTSPIDFWDEPSRVGRKVSLFVSPEQLNTVRGTLGSHHVDYRIEDYDVTEDLRIEWDRLSQNDLRAYNYSDFNRYETVLEEIVAIAERCPAEFECTISTLGQSIEGRNIDMLSIKMIDPPVPRQAIWMDSAIHAREWLSPATIMAIVNRMVTTYGSDDTATAFLGYDWYYTPMMNPDGYVWTWDEYRMWRKNRRDHPGSTCTGTDLNRNYDINWGQPGASGDECSDTYRGASVASEPETQAIQDFALTIKDDIKVFWSVHTHGEYLLSPWGNCTLPPDHDQIEEVTVKTCDAIAATYDTFWDCGNSCVVLYETSGTTSDWGYEKAGVQYSWTPELRGMNGAFIPPPSEIPFSVEEIWNGIEAMLQAIMEKEQ